jgi:hypothetical protein
MPSRVLAQVLLFAEVVSMSQKTPKVLPTHKDKLGRLINVGDFVAYPVRNSLEFGKVMKLNNKMVGVIPAVSKYKIYGNTNKYPSDLVRLDAQDMTWYILKNSS